MSRSANTDRPPQQNRSRVTTERFLEAAFKLLEKRSFADLSVSDLAKAAKRSVGVFYQRFNSKEDFLRILVFEFVGSEFKERADRAWTGQTAENVLSGFLRDTYQRILSHQNLWRAALALSASDPTFWSQFAGRRASLFKALIETIETRTGEKVSPPKARRIEIAVQVFNSVINNQIINGPGPLMIADDDFLPIMTEIAVKAALLRG